MGTDPVNERMRDELDELLGSARRGDLAPADFAARLESLRARFLGPDAHTSDMRERRRDAGRAYDDLIAGTDMDRHHHLERLTEALYPRHPS